MTLSRRLTRMTRPVNRSKIRHIIRTTAIAGNHMINLISTRLMTQPTHIRLPQNFAANQVPVTRQRGCRLRPTQKTCM